MGGVVAYSNAAKQALLGVPGALLDRGAVSEAVAAAMAAGARDRFSASCAVSTTGVAGPGGGGDEERIGTVCFGYADANGAKAWTVQIPDLGERSSGTARCSRSGGRSCLIRAARARMMLGSGARAPDRERVKICLRARG